VNGGQSVVSLFVNVTPQSKMVAMPNRKGGQRNEPNSVHLRFFAGIEKHTEWFETVKSEQSFFHCCSPVCSKAIAQLWLAKMAGTPRRIPGDGFAGKQKEQQLPLGLDSVQADLQRIVRSTSDLDEASDFKVCDQSCS
jgi:hypothetical protein